MPKIGRSTTGTGTGIYNASTPTLGDQDETSLQLDNAGNLLVKTVNAGSGSNPAAGATGSAVPADADYQGVSVAGTLTGVTGITVGGKTAPTVAVVDASGNQITSFGGSGGNAAAGPTGSAVPADADYVGFNSVGVRVQMQFAIRSSTWPTGTTTTTWTSATTNREGIFAAFKAAASAGGSYLPQLMTMGMG